jgi:hypothetical protein
MREKFVDTPWRRGLHMIDDGDDPVDRETGRQGAIPPAAARALAEAGARRKERADREAEPSKELGRDGPDPTRYGDWEKGGIASDF